MTFAQPTPGNALVAVTQGFVKLSVTAEIVDVFGCDDFIGDDTLISPGVTRHYIAIRGLQEAQKRAFNHRDPAGPGGETGSIGATPCG